MVDKLREIFERAQRQPEEEQNYIAEMVRREIEDQEWELSDELHQAIEESNVQYAVGDAEDFDKYDRKRRSARSSVLSHSHLQACEKRAGYFADTSG